MSFMLFTIWTLAIFTAGVCLSPKIRAKASIAANSGLKAEVHAKHQKADLYTRRSITGRNWLCIKCACGHIEEHLYRDLLDSSFKHHQENEYDAEVIRRGVDTP